MRPSILVGITLLLAFVSWQTNAFVPTADSHRLRVFLSKQQHLYSSSANKEPGTTKTAAEVAAEIEAEDSRSASGRLPKLRNNLYDEDEKFKDDPDWKTENVPGKIVINDVELAAQVAALNNLEEKWRKVRLQREYDENRFLGWTAKAETYNGRYAMFFLVVGLLTELWTGVSIPGQVEEMGRVLGFIEPQ
jgi:hypothetical protein